MNPIIMMNEEEFQSKLLEEKEYLNEIDGLIYCSICKTPRQRKIQWQDNVMFPRIRCSCQQKEYEKQEAEYKQKEFLIQVSRLKANGLQDKALKNPSFLG